MSGTLYVIGTPIGNLKDITFRAIDILKGVDLVVAEDSRVTRKLMMYYDIDKSIIVYHQHSYDERKFKILSSLINGNNIALVTDAGTPGISDPGNELIDFIVSKNIAVNIVPIPGASSVTSALSVSGFKTNEFLFLGYFPKKGILKVLKNIEDWGGTTVFFESPYRINKTVEKLIEYFGEEKKIFLAQEMTKLNERYFRGRLKDLSIYLGKENVNLGRIKGEIVFVI